MEGQDMSTTEANKALVHELYGTLMARGDVASAERILAESYRDHDLPGIGEGGRAELIQVVQGVRAAFPDITPTLYETLAEGELVAVRVIAHGTHTGAPFPPGIPAAGKALEWKELHIFRCTRGQIVEHWGVFDMLGILQQLGAVPA
jgi:predicted SnoaL-like aldol condensation-catalyzing enzyme